jgi:hypothetical protein
MIYGRTGFVTVPSLPLQYVDRLSIPLSPNPPLDRLVLNTFKGVDAHCHLFHPAPERRHTLGFSNLGRDTTQDVAL